MRRIVLAIVVLATGCARQCSAPERFPLGSVTRDVAFRRAPQLDGSTTTLRLDLHVPATPNGAAVVLIHGGAFIVGKRTDLDATADRLLRAGFVVASIDYRLGDRIISADSLDDHEVEIIRRAVADARGAIVWLRRHADAAHLDADRISAMGYSAGAVVALGAGMQGSDATTDRPTSRVCSVVSLSGAFDPRFASPDDAPVYFHHGGRDDWVPAALADDTRVALDSVGVPTRWDFTPGANHFFMPDDSSMRSIVGFLQRRTAPDSPSCPR